MSFSRAGFSYSDNPRLQTFLTDKARLTVSELDRIMVSDRGAIAGIFVGLMRDNFQNYRGPIDLFVHKPLEYTKLLTSAGYTIIESDLDSSKYKYCLRLKPKLFECQRRSVEVKIYCIDGNYSVEEILQEFLFNVEFYLYRDQQTKFIQSRNDKIELNPLYSERDLSFWAFTAIPTLIEYNEWYSCDWRNYAKFVIEGALIYAREEAGKLDPYKMTQVVLDRKVRKLRRHIRVLLLAILVKTEFCMGMEISCWQADPIVPNREHEVKFDDTNDEFNDPILRPKGFILTSPDNRVDISMYTMRIIEAKKFIYPNNWSHGIEKRKLNESDRSELMGGDCFNFEELNEPKIKDYLEEDVKNNIVILAPPEANEKFGRHAVCFKRTLLRNSMRDFTGVYLPCVGETGGYPVDPRVEFYTVNLTYKIYVPKPDILEMINNYDTQLFQVYPSAIELSRTASKNIAAAVGRGEAVDVSSSHHCQEGTSKKIHRIQPIEFQNLRRQRLEDIVSEAEKRIKEN